VKGGLSSYTSFDDVYSDALAGKFPNEASLKQAFIEALKNELYRSPCNKHIIDQMIFPVLDEVLSGKKPDIRFSNMIIEVEPPGGSIDVGRMQLHDYMNRLFMMVNGKVKVLGLVTNGVEAELWILDNNELKPQNQGAMPTVAAQALHIFCSDKIPVVTPEDLVRIFGV